MALSITKDKNLPKDAVLLTEFQAHQYQMGIIRNWEPLSEVFCLRAGAGVLASVSAISSMLILNHFRRKLKLGKLGQLTSYLPVVAMPTGLTALFHMKVVQSNIVLNKFDCPLCLQFRSAMLQTGLGFFYPYLLAPMASFMFATRHFTVRLPYVTEQPKEWLKFWFKLTRSSRNLGLYIFTANIAASSIITALEFKEHAFIQGQFQELEKKVESGYFVEKQNAM